MHHDVDLQECLEEGPNFREQAATDFIIDQGENYKETIEKSLRPPTRKLGEKHSLDQQEIEKRVEEFATAGSALITPGLPSAGVSRCLRRGPLSGLSRLEIDSSANNHILLVH